jgi:hypothetical protein
MLINILVPAAQEQLKNQNIRSKYTIIKNISLHISPAHQLACVTNLRPQK